MQKLVDVVKTNKFVLLLLLILILKIALVQVQPINVKPTMSYDDKLMVELAEHILQGNWLGEYSRFTLIKGVFTPLVIVFSCIINIPFLIVKECLYGLACILLITVLKKIIKNKVALSTLYVVILFNPIIYSSELCRLYRDGIYAALILYLVSFGIAIFLNVKDSIKKQIKYYVGFGLSLSAICLCREETIWLVPFLLFLLVTTVGLILFHKGIQNKIKRILLFCIPIALLLCSCGVISYINYQYYGVFTLNQYWGYSFKEAYGALTRVIPTQEIQRVPVSSETMQKVYEVSPKFRELEPFFEGNIAKKWQNINSFSDGEITGGYFHWALMQAVESKGYYQSAKQADEYYQALAKEINTACDKGLLVAYDKKIVSNTCRFDGYDLVEVARKMGKTIQYQCSLKDVKFAIYPVGEYLNIQKSEEEKFQKMAQQSKATGATYQGWYQSIRLQAIKVIGTIYQSINPVVLYISCGIYMILLIVGIKKYRELYREIWILTALAIIYLTRIFIVTFTATMMFEEALNYMYLSSIYAIQYAFCALSIMTMITIIKKGITNGKHTINNTNTSAQ